MLGVNTLVQCGRVASAVCLGGLLVTGCATGRESLVGGSDRAAVGAEAPMSFEDAAPGILVASGNALLPGSRGPAAEAALGIGANAAPLTPTGLSSTDLAGRPLLALNGLQSPLLGLAATASRPAGLIGSGGAAPTAAIAITPAVSATGLLATLGAVAPLAPPATPGGGVAPTLPPIVPGGGVAPPPLPPVLPPTVVSRVPGVVPLTVLVSNLQGATGGLLGR